MQGGRRCLGPPALILLRWGPLGNGVPLWGNVTVAEVSGKSHAGWGGKDGLQTALSSLARVSTGSMASVADEARSVRDQGGTSVTAVATIGQPTFSKCLWQFRWSKSFTVKADEEEALQEGK